MFITLFFISLIFIIFITFWTISKIIILNKNIENLSSNISVLQKDITSFTNKIKMFIKPKQKQEKRIKTLDIFLLLTDVILITFYKKNYEKVKNYYDFLKNTLA